MLRLGRFYTRRHEWIDINNEIATVGITQFLEDQIGKVTHVKFPSKRNIYQESDNVVYVRTTILDGWVTAPMSGQLLEINPKVIRDPSLLNLLPEVDGWLFRIRIGNFREAFSLLTPVEYWKFREEK